MTRYAMIKRPKGVWELIKHQDGPWLLFADHDKIVADQRAVIERLDQLTTMQDGGIRSLHEQIVQKDAEITALKAQVAKTKGKTVRTVTTYGAYEDPI